MRILSLFSFCLQSYKDIFEENQKVYTEQLQEFKNSISADEWAEIQKEKRDKFAETKKKREKKVKKERKKVCVYHSFPVQGLTCFLFCLSCVPCSDARFDFLT